MSLGKEYLKTVQKRFLESRQTAEKAIRQLSAEQWFFQPNEDSNSIAIIMKHMSGNMISRWTSLLTEDGEKADRHRDEEFEQDFDAKKLLEMWDKGWDLFLSVLAELTEDDLLKPVRIRNEPHTVMEAIERQMYHYSYHVGQIVYLAKQVKGDSWVTLTIPKRKG